MVLRSFKPCSYRSSTTMFTVYFEQGGLCYCFFSFLIREGKRSLLIVILSRLYLMMLMLLLLIRRLLLLRTVLPYTSIYHHQHRSFYCKMLCPFISIDNICSIWHLSIATGTPIVELHRRLLLFLLIDPRFLLTTMTNTYNDGCYR